MTEPQQQQQPSRWPYIVGALVALVSIIAAAVVLSLAGRSEGTIAGLIATVVTSLSLVIPLIREQQQQTSTLATIAHNTNGVLDQRIHDAVTSAITSRVPTLHQTTIPDLPDDPPHNVEPTG